MKRLNSQVVLGVGLILASALIYAAHWLIFHDVEHILVFGLGELAFLPIEVLLVTMVIERLFERQERRRRFEKTNMVIGVFFSEVGDDLLQRFSTADAKLVELRESLKIGPKWTPKDYKALRSRLTAYDYAIDIAKIDLADLRAWLGGRRDFLVRLLENPSLLEHETFTELLTATFHLADELGHRGRFDGLPVSDLAHLAVDITRVYGRLVDAWLDYLRHLQEHHLYLFSLAVRSNPLNTEASVVVD